MLLNAFQHSATLKQMLRINGDIQVAMPFRLHNIAHTPKENGALVKKYTQEKHRERNIHYGEQS